MIAKTLSPAELHNMGSKRLQGLVMQVVTLTGMAALASEVKAAKSLLKLPDQDSEKAATATETLCQINGCARLHSC